MTQKKSDKVKEAQHLTYILDLVNGKTRQLTVDTDKHITFGPMVPGTAFDNGVRQGRRPFCFRIYDRDKRQLACFTDVIAFREKSLDIAQEITNIKMMEGTSDHQFLTASEEDNDKLYVAPNPF